MNIENEINISTIKSHQTLRHSCIIHIMYLKNCKNEKNLEIQSSPIV